MGVLSSKFGYQQETILIFNTGFVKRITGFFSAIRPKAHAPNFWLFAQAHPPNISLFYRFVLLFFNKNRLLSMYVVNKVRRGLCSTNMLLNVAYFGYNSVKEFSKSTYK